LSVLFGLDNFRGCCRCKVSWLGDGSGRRGSCLHLRGNRGCIVDSGVRRGPGYGRLDRGGLFRGVWLLFAGSRGRCCSLGSHACGRLRNHNNGRLCDDCAGRRLGDHSPHGRAGNNGRCRGRRHNDRWHRTRLGHNPARFRTSRRRRGCGNHGGRWGRCRSRRGSSRWLRALRHARVARFSFLLLLLG
jgi:hypothetical protein